MSYLSRLKKVVVAASIIISGFFFLSLGFAFKKLQPASPIIGHTLQPLVQKESQLAVSCEWMSPDESKQVFGHDFPSRSVYPLKVSVQNNTSKEYSLSASSVDLPAVDASKVAFKVTKSAIPRSIAYKVASFFFWPLMIPSTIDGIRVMSHHNSLKKEIRAKSLKSQEGETVAPYSAFHRVLFIDKKDVKDSFKVTIIDIENSQQKQFDINTNNNIS